MDGSGHNSASEQLASLLEDIYRATMPPEGEQQQVKCHVGWLIGIQQQELQSTASLLAPDAFIRRAGGVPLHTLLLAVPPKESEVVDFGGKRICSPGILLVRPIGTLTDMQRSGAETLFQHYRQNPQPGPTQSLPDAFGLGLDAYTKHIQSYGGFSCQALGTLYSGQDDEGGLVLKFSPDVEYAPFDCGYTVIKPPNKMMSQVLREISGRGGSECRIRLGQVLYSATQNLQPLAAQAREDVSGGIELGLDLDEILARRTALFGMTRTGKSNTVKVLATNIAVQRPEVGHLIFDVNGEYAHANQRDNGSLALALARTGRVDILSSIKVGRGQGRTLLPNFFMDMNLGMALSLAAMNNKPTSEAFNTFSQMRFVEFPESDMKTWLDPQIEATKALMFRCLLTSAGYPGMTAKSIKETTDRQWAGFRGADWHEYTEVSKALSCEGIAAAATRASRSQDSEVSALGQLAAGRNTGDRSITGRGYVGSARDHHSEHGPEQGLGNFLCQAMDQGRVVILDLSLTAPSAQSALMEYIASRLFREATARFTQWLEANGEEKQVCSWMIYIEEAHNLIGPAANADDPWPRLAKEGGKMGIGMVFATQEPSGIQTNIMSNTDNFLVSHLNNKREVREISEYGDLETFSGSIIRVRTPGYVRLRQRDLPFSLPVQVDRFSMQWASELLDLHGYPKNAPQQRLSVAPEVVDATKTEQMSNRASSSPVRASIRSNAGHQDAAIAPAATHHTPPASTSAPSAPSTRPRRFGEPKDTKG